MTFPDTIECERLTLRRPQMSDAGPIAHYVGDKRVAEMLTSVPHPYPPGAAEAFIDRSLADATREHVWVMDALKIDGPEFIGAISLKAKDGAHELGYWVGSPFWNTGYASEAAAGVVKTARRLGAAVTAQIATANEASAHVLVNAGFAEEGYAEAFSVARGEMVPMRRFTLAASDAEA